MRLKKTYLILFLFLFILAFFLFIQCGKSEVNKHQLSADARKDTIPLTGESSNVDSLRLDTARYNALISYIVHDKPSNKWPVKTGYPLPGAILPFKRIVAYYGNFYSAAMGILGELPPEEMLQKLQGEVKKWELADTLIAVQPALEYIAVT